MGDRAAVEPHIDDMTHGIGENDSLATDELQLIVKKLADARDIRALVKRLIGFD